MRLRWILVGLLVLLICALVPLSADAAEMLTVFLNGEYVQMYREAYLIGVVAAEMPAVYELAALEAQAVAARTRTVGTSCRSHPRADVCGESSCCQGYLDEAEQQARWGEDTDYYRARIQEAVATTRGVIMTYDNEPIEVLYHAVSGGYTENVEAVYKEALPYLRGVASPGEEGSPGYETMMTFTQAELASAFPDEVRGGVVALEVLERSDSGRVLSIRVGVHEMTGRVFRSALGLKSTNFTIAGDGDMVVISQRGYGHGVGMSQAGANAMALEGATYEEILLHYYTGVEMTVLAD